jgi:hypothetical protein
LDKRHTFPFSHSGEVKGPEMGRWLMLMTRENKVQTINLTEMNTGNHNPLPTKATMAPTGRKPRVKKTAEPKLRKNQWASLEQIAWLNERTHEYHDIQADPDRDFTTFWAQVFESWLEKWPIPALTPEQTALGLDKKTITDAVKAVSP